MSTLLALDPSIRSAGVAIFHVGECVAAARIQVAASKVPPAERCLAMVRQIVAWCAPWRISAVVTEWPQIYRASKSEGDPNDLTGLAGVGMGVIGRLSEHVPFSVKSPTPAEWAGALPKSTRGDPWASARGLRIAKRLSATERARVPDSHDALDAVGLGLWACGRFERIRVFPGAT